MCIKRYKSAARRQVGAGYRSSKCQLEAIQLLAAVFVMASGPLEPLQSATVHIWIYTVTSGYLSSLSLLLWLLFIDLFMFGCFILSREEYVFFPAVMLSEVRGLMCSLGRVIEMHFCVCVAGAPKTLCRPGSCCL